MSEYCASVYPMGAWLGIETSIISWSVHHGKAVKLLRKSCVRSSQQVGRKRTWHANAKAQGKCRSMPSNIACMSLSHIRVNVCSHRQQRSEAASYLQSILQSWKQPKNETSTVVCFGSPIVRSDLASRQKPLALRLRFLKPADAAKLVGW